MSHARVAVFVKNKNEHEVEQQMAPFDENLKVEFEPCSTESLDRLKDWCAESKSGKTLEEFAKDMGYTVENGVIGYYHNPKARWDYWTIIGIDSDCLKDPSIYARDDFDTDFCPVREFAIKKQYTPEEIDEIKEEWEDLISPSGSGLFVPEYYLDRYGTFENFLEEQSYNCPWAFVLDGEWYETGKLGWFACSDATRDSAAEYHKAFEKILNDPKYQDYYISWIDFHI